MQPPSVALISIAISSQCFIVTKAYAAKRAAANAGRNEKEKRAV